jgi:hypothetical protein
VHELQRLIRSHKDNIESHAKKHASELADSHQASHDVETKKLRIHDTHDLRCFAQLAGVLEFPVDWELRQFQELVTGWKRPVTSPRLMELECSIIWHAPGRVKPPIGCVGVEVILRILADPRVAVEDILMILAEIAVRSVPEWIQSDEYMRTKHMHIVQVLTCRAISYHACHTTDARFVTHQ